MNPHISRGQHSGLVNRQRSRRRLISLTPLIDVVFILLVFFMLASSFLDWRTIHLNALETTKMGSPIEGALLVEIRSDGLRLSGQAVSLDGLAKRLADHRERKRDQRVFVNPREGVSLQEAVTVLERIAATGVTDISFIRNTVR